MAESHALKLCVAFEEKQQAKQTSFKRLQMFFTVLFERQLRQISHLRFFAKHILKNAQVQNTCKTILQTKTPFSKQLKNNCSKNSTNFKQLKNNCSRNCTNFKKLKNNCPNNCQGQNNCRGQGKCGGLRSFLKTFKPSRRHCHGW